MRFPPEHLIDACITQLNEGVDLETVLEAHPEEADELRPLLAAVAWMRMDIPAPQRRIEGKQAIMAAAVRRRRQVEITQGYLNELNAGEPFEALYERAEPAMRPLLIAAWRMLSTEPPTPDPVKRAEGKRWLMTQVAERRAERQRELAASMSPVSHLRVGFAGLLGGVRIPPSLLRRTLSGAAAMTAVLAALVVGGRGIGTAAADSLPGEAFYRVKRLGESARMVFAFDPARRAELDQSFSRERLLELIDLATSGRELPELALTEWAEEQRNVFAAIRRLPLEQQVALGEALLDSFADLDAIGAILSGSGAEELLAWLDAESTTETAPVLTETGRVQELLPLQIDRAPMPVRRPLPPSDEVKTPDVATVEPPVLVEMEPVDEEPLPEESVQFVQPAPPSEDDDDDRDERPVADEAPADEAPAAEPTDDTQFVLPPMEDPTPTPEKPGENPGAGEEPVEPREPAPTP